MTDPTNQHDLRLTALGPFFVHPHDSGVYGRGPDGRPYLMATIHRADDNARRSSDMTAGDYLAAIAAQGRTAGFIVDAMNEKLARHKNQARPEDLK